MKTFRKGMDIFREVLTTDILNEIGGAVRSVGELKERLAAGDLGSANAILCFSSAAVARGLCVVPAGIAASPEKLSPSGAVRPPLAVRAATASDAGSVWGIALESAAVGVGFRCAFSGFAVVPLATSEGDGAWLAPGTDGTPVRTSSATRCRVLAVVDAASDGDGGDSPEAYALVRMDDIGTAPCPQWRITATPPEEEGGKWTVVVQGGSVVVADISLDSSGGGSGGSGGGGSGGGGSGGGDDEGGSGHSHGGGRSGGPGSGEDAIRVPEITYGG